MGEAFDVNQYWLKRGQNYIQERFPQEFHQLQQSFLVEVLRQSQIPLNRILELGCGFGRITRLVAEAFPHASITALDLSPHQLEQARRHCGSCRNVSFQQYDFYSGAPLPGTDHDAALAIEVFLHHPPDLVRALVARLAGVARHIVSIDWSEPWPWKTAEHVWVRDYRALYEESGLQCATFVLPERIEGMQQKLFIAARELGPRLRQLEQAVEASRSRHAGPLPAADVSPWPEQVHLGVEEICRVIPAGATLILVNEDQWGNESQTLAEYKVFPFLERDGAYWGPPDGDATAVSELERLRRAGASYIVFAWPAFWWLQHYARFRDHLQTTGRCLLENERLVIFRFPQ